MGTSAGSPESVGEERASTQNDTVPVSSTQLNHLITFIQETLPRINKQEKLSNWTFSIVALGFIVLVVSVGGFVLSSVYSQIQAANEANDRTSDALNRLNEKLDTLVTKPNGQ